MLQRGAESGPFILTALSTVVEWCARARTPTDKGREVFRGVAVKRKERMIKSHFLKENKIGQIWIYYILTGRNQMRESGRKGKIKGAKNLKWEGVGDGGGGRLTFPSEMWRKATGPGAAEDVR